jgi:hypothetical protein
VARCGRRVSAPANFLGAAVQRRRGARVSGARWRGARGGFYRWRGEGRRRGQGGGRQARWRPPLRPVGSVGRPFPGEEEAGAAWGGDG